MMEATSSEGPIMVRCNVKNGRPLWHCPRMFEQDYRDVKGQLVPYKSCPQHRASINKSSKTPAAKARLERNKHSKKGKITNKKYASGPKRQETLRKYEQKLCDRFHEENPEYSTTECVVCE